MHKLYILRFTDKFYNGFAFHEGTTELRLFTNNTLLASASPLSTTHDRQNNKGKVGKRQTYR